MPRGKPVPGGLLGADFEIANGHYRFKRIYTGESWNPQLRAPLSEPGINVKEGEYLLGGERPRSFGLRMTLLAWLEGTAGEAHFAAGRPGPYRSQCARR